MHPSSTLAVLLGAAAATAQVGRLVVCVQEGSELIDLDENEIWTGAGSDAFVTIMVQADSKETQTRATTVEQDNASPLWNECFDFGPGYTLSTSVVFAVADGDMNSDDDVIGVACTSAGTGTRWLELGESSGSSSSSARGRIKVQIMLIAEELIDASEDLDFELTNVLSELSAPPTVDYRATASVSCPSGRNMVACQCWSAGNPGCAGSSIEYDPVRNADVCRAEAHPAPPPPTPPPPCDPNADPACRLSMLMPPPPPPVGIRASARCGAFDPRTMWRTVQSVKSRSRAGDAVEATCPVGYTPLGCSLYPGSNAAIGARFEEAGCDDDHAASSCTDSRETCVAYAAAQHSHDGGVRAEARCAKLGVEQGSGMAHLSVPVKSAMLADVGITSVSVACPEPLQLTGCACMSSQGNCRGAQFAIASGPPPAVAIAINGQAAAVAGGSDAIASSASGDATDFAPHPVCNASLEAPLARWWTTGGSANAQCVWVGRASRLLGRDESGHVGELCALQGDVLSDKPWLPAGWKAIVAAMAELNAQPAPSPPSVSTREAGSLFGSGFVAGFFTAVTMLCFCVLGAVTLKRRHLNTLGGSPLQAPAPPLGSPLPPSSSSTTTTMAAPLVLNDSATHA